MAHRAAAHRQRELQKQAREAEKARIAHAKDAERLHAANEAASFENYLEVIVSLHKECSDTWNWLTIYNSGPPTAPVRSGARANAAELALQNYRPSFFQKLFGGDKKIVASLTEAIPQARTLDETEYLDSYRNYEQLFGDWASRRNLAARMLSKDTSAYQDALKLAEAFDELADLHTTVTLAAANGEAVAFTCHMTDQDVVPNEEFKLTATGKLSSKAMPAGKYWGIYQDHVCSLAIRTACEAFAVLPVNRAIVNVVTTQPSRVTGHQEQITILGAHFNRKGMAAINLEAIDPSDAMRNFPHRMKFKKTAGLDPVQPITLDEQWVET